MTALQKAKKGLTRDQLIEMQLEQYGGTKSWANYQVDNYTKLLKYMELITVSKDGIFKLV